MCYDGINKRIVTGKQAKPKYIRDALFGANQEVVFGVCLGFSVFPEKKGAEKWQRIIQIWLQTL
ncbi:hypothetical protein GUT183_16330 [Streptococcus ruminantium]|nr:hypothetical protein GUT183_16330 [Streptococcus ruminantium]